MKALALVLVLVTMGDLVVDRGAVVRAAGHAGHAFLVDCEDAVAGSLFAA